MRSYVSLWTSICWRYLPDHSQHRSRWVDSPWQWFMISDENKLKICHQNHLFLLTRSTLRSQGAKRELTNILDWVLSPKVNSECILNLEICSKIHWILKNFIIRHRTSQFRKTTQYQWDFTFSQLFRKMISFGHQNRGPDASRYYSLIPKSDCFFSKRFWSSLKKPTEEKMCHAPILPPAKSDYNSPEERREEGGRDRIDNLVRDSRWT